MNDGFERLWKEIRMGIRIIMPEEVQKIAKRLLAV
jgi:hypothetical protein